MKTVISCLLCLLVLVGMLAVNVAAEGTVPAEDASSNSAVMWALMVVGVLLVAAAVAIFVLVVFRKKGHK